MFTLKDVDLEIMMMLDDESLDNICNTNQYMHHLCNNPFFWKKRLNHFYPDIITNKNYKELYKILSKIHKMNDEVYIKIILETPLTKNDIKKLLPYIQDLNIYKYHEISYWVPNNVTNVYNSIKTIVEYSESFDPNKIILKKDVIEYI